MDEAGSRRFFTSKRSTESHSRFLLVPPIADSVCICFVNNTAEYRPVLGRELLHNRSPEGVFYNTATFAMANRSCGLPIDEGGFACLGTSQIWHGQTFDTDQPKGMDVTEKVKLFLTPRRRRPPQLREVSGCRSFGGVKTLLCFTSTKSASGMICPSTQMASSTMELTTRCLVGSTRTCSARWEG